MTASDIFVAYLKILLAAFEYDIEVYSQGWLYAWVLLPAAAYTAFFFMKWLVLTLPMTLPLCIATSLIKAIFSRSCSSEDK